MHLAQCLICGQNFKTFVEFDPQPKPVQGTGSYPFPPHGLQLIIRLMDSQPPLKSPCFFKASKVYCEQVGE